MLVGRAAVGKVGALFFAGDASTSALALGGVSWLALSGDLGSCAGIDEGRW